MNAFLEQLNNKEYAWIFYVLVVVFLCLLSKNLRSQFKNIIQLLFNKRFIKIYLIVFPYITLSIILLRWVGIWDLSLLKDTIFWIFLVAFPLMYKINKIDSFDKFTKNIIFPLFKFSVFFEFVFGLYTFSLWVELLIIPIVLLIALLMAASESKPEHRQVHRLFQWIMNLLVLGILFSIGKHLFNHYREYCTMETLMQFLNPLCLSILFLPVLYGLAMFLHYESALSILKRYLKDAGNYRYAVIQSMLRFNGDLEGLLRWKNLIVVKHLQSKEDILNAIKLIKTLQKTEKNPHTVNPALGWSPYLAKNFLLSMGIETPPYSNTYEDEFHTISNYIKINKNLIEDTICYSVSGDQLIANELHLSLRVFYGNKSLGSRLIFLDFVRQLYSVALEQPVPIQLEQAIEDGKAYKGRTELADVQLKKETWKTNTNGYNFDFRIVHSPS